MALACLDTFEQLDEELGLPTGLNQGGYLLVAYKDKEWAQFKKNVELQHSLGIKTEIFTDVKRAQEICPGVAVDDALGFTLLSERRTCGPVPDDIRLPGSGKAPRSKIL